MFEEINRQLAEATVNLRSKQNRERRLAFIDEEIQQEVNNVERFRKQMLGEQQDVVRLTGISFGALFYSLLGKKEEKLLQESQQLLQARLKYDEAAATLLDLQNEAAQLKQDIGNASNAENEMQRLLKRKKQLIQAYNPDLSHQLDDLSGRQSDTEASLRELREAVSAGRSLLEHLDHAKDRLESAKDWGTWDLLGGGLLTTALKHDRLDEAREAVHSAQRSLRIFNKELNDVQRNLSLTIDIGELLTFADYFFDGLIVDWVVQGRISDSLDQLDDKLSQVHKIMAELNAEVRRSDKELQQLRNQTAALIESA